MNIRLKAGESPGHALQRACSGHVAAALVCLKKADQREAVHDIRKEVKKMRAIFRLAEDGLRRKNYRKIAKSMRLSTKPLAAIRDARVTRQTFKMLAGRKAQKFPRIQSALEAQFSQAGRDYTGNDFGSIIRLVLKQTSRLVNDLDLKEVHWPEVQTRLRESYARGRKAYQQVLKQPSPEHLHQWRKQVKILCYQLNFLCPNWSGESKQLVTALDQLGEQLGNSHDLVLLQHFASERCRNADETQQLNLLADAKLSECEAEIKRLGAKTYSRTPKTVSAKLAADLKLWRTRG